MIRAYVTYWWHRCLVKLVGVLVALAYPPEKDEKDATHERGEDRPV